jgi:O-antigen/teichoic acid export membrane protein
VSARRALTFSFLDRYASLIVTVGSTMVLARLLSPAEIGVFSVTMALLSFASVFRDLGAGQYLIQVKEPAIERIRAVWTVQLGSGLALAALVLAIRTPVATIYHEPQMRDIMLVVALNFALTPIGSLTYAWLAREMRFDSIAIIRFTSSIAGAATTIFLAFGGHGAISMALGNLAGTIATMVVSMAYRPNSLPWLPGMRDLKLVLRFGGGLTSTSLLNTLAAATPELLLGKLQSLATVGYYSRANGLVAMFQRLVTDAVWSVSLSVFARESREHGRCNIAFLQATSYIAALGWSFCAALIWLAHPTMRVFCGAQWDDAVELTRMLAVAMAIGMPGMLCGPAFTAQGAVRQLLRGTLVCTAASVACSAAGVTWGLAGIGWAAVACAMFCTLVWMRIAHRAIGFTWSELAASLAPGAGVALAASIVPAAVVLVMGPAPDASLTALIVGYPGCLFGFLAGAWVLRHPIRREIEKLMTRRFAS